MELERFLRLKPDEMDIDEAAFMLKLAEAAIHKDPQHPYWDARSPFHKEAVSKLHELRTASDPRAGKSQFERLAEDAFREQKARREAEQKQRDLQAGRVLNELKSFGVNVSDATAKRLNRHQLSAIEGQLFLEKGDKARLLSKLSDDLHFLGKSDKFSLLARAVEEVGLEDRTIRGMVLGFLSDAARERAAHDIQLIQEQQEIGFSHFQDETPQNGDIQDGIEQAEDII